MSKSTGGSAFPLPGDSRSRGMTLRDYFAAAALQGAMASSNEWEHPDTLSKYAYQVADAMIAEREKP